MTCDRAAVESVSACVVKSVGRVNGPGHVTRVDCREIARRNHYVAGHVYDRPLAPLGDHHHASIVLVDCANGRVLMVDGQVELRLGVGEPSDGATILRVRVAGASFRRHKVIETGRDVCETIVPLPAQNAGRQAIGDSGGLRFLLKSTTTTES